MIIDTVLPQSKHEQIISNIRLATIFILYITTVSSKRICWRHVASNLPVGNSIVSFNKQKLNGIKETFQTNKNKTGNTKFYFAEPPCKTCMTLTNTDCHVGKCSSSSKFCNKVENIKKEFSNLTITLIMSKLNKNYSLDIRGYVYMHKVGWLVSLLNRKNPKMYQQDKLAVTKLWFLCSMVTVFYVSNGPTNMEAPVPNFQDQLSRHHHDFLLLVVVACMPWYAHSSGVPALCLYVFLGLDFSSFKHCLHVRKL